MNQVLNKFSLLILFLFFISSCIVQGPRYTRVEKVLTLKLGMTKEEVSKTLNVSPYDLKAITDSTETLIYKYRVTDRRTIPFLMKPNNGTSVTGKYVDLFITFSKEGKAINIESCSDCEKTDEKRMKIDFNKIITFITVTTPALLIYLGLANPH
jgi:hypothetical protein